MKRIEDERILIEKRKINSRAFSYSYIGLWILLVYRQFVLNQEGAVGKQGNLAPDL